MASSAANLETKFHAAVKAIQQLPPDGTFQPSNEMKLTFYGLYKQVTAGPCKDPRPSMFNYVNRAKWDAWNKCRAMSKEAAMSAYIDEMRKILETMPQTNEVLELTQLIGPFYEFVDDEQSAQNGPVTFVKRNVSKKKQNLLVNGTENDDHDKQHPLANGTGQVVSAGNGPGPSSSPSSSSSSISSSDIDDIYDDPSDRLPFYSALPNDDNAAQNDPANVSSEQPSHDVTRIQPHTFGGQNGSNIPVQHSARGGGGGGGNHSNESRASSRSSLRHHGPANGARHSFTSAASGGGNGRDPYKTNSNETQRAILTALTKLQRDVNNILERLNRLETSSHFLQQRDLSLQLLARQESTSVPRWLPLAGFRRRAVAFIVLWPFIAFVLIRLFLRARIIIRFRRTRPS